ncbi:histidine phosphatase family protein [Cupriavidus pauculus]|jgi:alpha-ribazole phosphatase|uniref:histidine phosphatase family protein n=1 Tax=Cupriavidus pauculus TaxID=82633 RepID=UPI0030F67459
MEVVLIRHSAPDVSPGICYGSLDVPLASPMSPAAAEIVAKLAPPDRIVASPAARAMQTATRLVACMDNAPDIEVEQRLRELHFGAWEGLAWEAIGRDALDLWAADLMNARPHGGETATQAMGRIGAWADSLDAASDERIWVITHAGPMRMLAARWLELPLEKTLGWRLAFGASCGFQVTPASASLSWWNCR